MKTCLLSGNFSIIFLHPVAKNDTGSTLPLHTHHTSLVAKKGGIKQSLTLKNKTNRQYGKY